MDGTVIGGVAFVGGAAIIRALVDRKPITKIIAGSFLSLAFLGAIELAGGETEKLADALVVLAAIVVTIDVLPWQNVLNILNVKVAHNGTG